MAFESSEFIICAYVGPLACKINFDGNTCLDTAVELIKYNLLSVVVTPMKVYIF